MQSDEIGWMKGYTRETYSEKAVRRALSKYSFLFKFAGVSCRAGYDPPNNSFYIDGAIDCQDDLLDLAADVEELIRTTKPMLAPALLDLYRFLCNHLKAMMKVQQELQRAPLSERRFEFLDEQPVDKNDLSLEEQCLFELMDENKAERARTAGGGDDGATHTITPEMIADKMKVKMQHSDHRPEAERDKFEHGAEVPRTQSTPTLLARWDWEEIPADLVSFPPSKHGEGHSGR
jgi:hypothetical protein